MNEVEERLSEYLIVMSSKLLNCTKEDIHWEDDIDEYGFSSMEINALCSKICDVFNIEVQPVVFLEHTSLADFSKYLLSNYENKIDSVLFSPNAGVSYD